MQINGTSDPREDGKGMDATEASVALGFGSAESGKIERGYGLFETPWPTLSSRAAKAAQGGAQ